MAKFWSIKNVSNSRSSRIKRNILGSFLVKGVSVIISFLLVPLTLGYVSGELYGVWLTLSSMSVWISFFDIGFTLGLKNKLAEAVATGDKKRGKELVSTTYALVFAIFTPICIIAILLIPFINWCNLLNAPSLYSDDIKNAMTIIVICFSFQMVLSILSTIFQSLQRVAVSSLFPVLANSLSLVLIYLSTIYVKPSLTVLAFCISTAPVLVYAVTSIILFNGKLSYLAPSFRYVKFYHFHGLFELGAKFFIIQVQVIVFFQTTNLLISNISSPEIVSVYNIAYKYMGTATMLFTIVMNPFWPAFTDASVKGDFTWMNNVYHKLKNFYILFLFGIFMMVLLSPYVYDVWIGHNIHIPLSWTILIAVYIIINCWNSLHVYIINGIGILKLQSYVILLGLAFHIPLSYFLSNYIGAMGVVVSMATISFIYSAIFTIQVRKYLSGNASGIWTM